MHIKKSFDKMVENQNRAKFLFNAFFSILLSDEEITKEELKTEYFKITKAIDKIIDPFSGNE